ncbi:hypothetical protein ACQKWADRAFT_276948 [Trichoderma austrokoningii]
MDQEDGFVEFYITCNPPLLSRGVEHIIETANVACLNGELFEILYEPDIPWFKCITMGKHKEYVTRIIRDLLLELVDLEVVRLKFDAQKDVIDTDVLQADVTMKAAKPRLISWMEYQSLGTDIHDSFVQYQYPESMASLPYKAIWRGLENSSGTFENFLTEFRLLIKSEMAPATTADFAVCNDCHISYNVRGNLVYIGSSISAAALKNVVRKLEAVLTLLASKIKTTTHSILTEGPEDVRLAYRWLHSIGLHQATFAVPCGNVTVADEYQLLLNAAAIRMEKKDKFGRWTPDDAVYPLQNAAKTDARQKFKAFKDFYPNRKLLFEGIRPVPYGLQPAANEISSSTEAQEPKLETILQQGVKNYHGAPGPDLFDQQPPTLDRQTYKSTVAEDVPGQRSRFVERLTLNNIPQQPMHSQQSIRDSLLIDWVEGIETMNDSNQEELLISFNESSSESQCFVMESSSMDDECRRLQKGIMQAEQAKQANQSDDLIMLDNEPEAPRPNTVQISDNHLADMCLLSSGIPQMENLFAPVLDKGATVLDESNPLEAREMNTFSNSLVHFGLMQEKPREVYRTMNQRTGRASDKVTKGPPYPNTATGERPSTRAPAKGRPNPSEDEFPPLGGGPSSSTKKVKPLVSYSDAAKLPGSRTQQAWPKVSMLKAANEPLPPLSAEIFCPTGDAGKGKSKEPRDALPENSFHYAVPQKSDILRHCESQLKDMSQILELSPGYISLEIVFGRIYIKKLAPRMVNDSASQRSYQSVDEATNFLNGPNFPPDCVGVSPILSTMGGDGDLLANITPPGDVPWRLSEREIWFDFRCNFPDSRGEFFILELNAKTFQYRCRGPRTELFSMYLHCPGSAWDMKACGARSTALGGEAKFASFAASLFEHMSINVVEDSGEMTIELFEDEDSQRAFECITMRQVAKYRHEKKVDNSLLSITMNYTLEESVSPAICGRTEKNLGKKRKFVISDGASNSALPHQYLEASITSSRVSALFEENVRLGNGDKATWNTDLLEEQGVFGDILRPAFGMITHMDLIGASNNSMRYVGDQDAFHEPALVSAGKKKVVEFW